MQTKKPWESKTILVNLILALSAFIPAVHDQLVAHPEYFTYAILVLNIVLRLVTKGAIQIADDSAA
jgi:hypothetical protein